MLATNFIFKMAASKYGVSKIFFFSDFHPVNIFLSHQNFLKNIQRNTHFFRHLAAGKEHNENNYEYEITKDPNEWKYVEKLFRHKTVPEPKVKSEYPSGWVPMKEKALKLPYFVQRSKNHMLPVYFIKKSLNPDPVTKITKIHGDLWGLHDDLHKYLEEKLEKKIPSMVNEGNNTISFLGDYVYYVEEWLLEKGY